MARPRARLLCCSALLLAGALASCAKNGAEATLKNYTERLARPLDTAAAQVNTIDPPVPPRATALQITLAGSKLDGLDFLRLRGCKLQQTVAKRNSSLGRVAPPSQRLLLELAFLREAPECIEKMRSDGQLELANALVDSAALKKSQLPALIFNATLGTAEYRDFWRAGGLAADYPEDTSSLVVTALERVGADAKRWLSGDYAADESEFELALAEIARGDGGELLRAIAQQNAYLAAADAMIDRRLADGPLCRGNAKPRAASIVRTVARKFFVGEVQIVAASLNKRHLALRGPIAVLESLVSNASPDAYKSWQAERDKLLEAGAAAPARHVESLQRLLGDCYAEFAPAG